ncbi:MAG: Arm DNA-binding domain-containing protein [gamma proteobacterium symbiont of Taylorina sp.]|nr:Arm DNA-binding domain-containing protein [gamma proteobacterium symbiont of Taylorina sp.]
MAKQIISPKNGFTTTYLNKLKIKEKQFELKDHASKGLRIRISPSGNKTFIWRYMTKDRKSRVYTIGYFVDKYESDEETRNITLSDAREKLLFLKAQHKAGNLLTAKEQKHVDEEKREYENKLNITLGEKIEDFYKTLEVNRRTPETARHIISAEILGERKGFEGIVLGDIVLREVTSQGVQELIYNTINRGTPELAMSILTLLKQFFSWCENGDHIEHSPIDKLNRKYFGSTEPKIEHIFDIAPEEEGGEPITGLPEIVSFFQYLDSSLCYSIQTRTN